MAQSASSAFSYSDLSCQVGVLREETDAVILRGFSYDEAWDVGTHLAVAPELQGSVVIYSKSIPLSNLGNANHGDDAHVHHGEETWKKGPHSFCVFQTANISFVKAALTQAICPVKVVICVPDNVSQIAEVAMAVKQNMGLRDFASGNIITVALINKTRVDKEDLMIATTTIFGKDKTQTYSKPYSRAIVDSITTSRSNQKKALLFRATHGNGTELVHLLHAISDLEVLGWKASTDSEKMFLKRFNPFPWQTIPRIASNLSELEKAVFDPCVNIDVVVAIPNITMDLIWVAKLLMDAEEERAGWPDHPFLVVVVEDDRGIDFEEVRTLAVSIFGTGLQVYDGRA